MGDVAAHADGCPDSGASCWLLRAGARLVGDEGRERGGKEGQWNERRGKDKEGKERER